MNAMQWRRACALLVALIATACGGSSPPPGSSGPGGTGERINGNERLGWNQGAANAAELAIFRYAAYVDGTRVELADVNCGPADSSFQCSSRMPSMTPGAHTLELVSFVERDGVVAESGRSAPLRVTLGTLTAPPDAANSRGTPSSQVTSDGVQLSIAIVAEGLASPTALAFPPGGSAFLAERGGRIRVIDAEGSTPLVAVDAGQPAADLTDAIVTGNAGGVLDIAIDPEFTRTRWVYVLYTGEGRDGGPVFRLARFREAGRRLGERIVIVDDVPASPVRPAAAIGFGGDGKLYVALDAAGDEGRSERAASYNGKVLRLEPGGTTPADHTSRTPTFAAGLYSPRGLDWHPASGTLWVADVNAAEADELRSWPNAASRARAVTLPPGTGTAAMTFYRGDLIPGLQGNALVATESGRLLRVRFDRRDPARLAGVERLIDGLPGPATFVSVSPGGAIYVGTDRTIFRMTPTAQ